MKPITKILALGLFAPVAFFGRQSSGSAGQSGSDTAKTTRSSVTANQTPGGAKKKKVWTNDEISTVGGPGSISVVGNKSDGTAAQQDSHRDAGANGAAALKQHQIESYRDRLRQLNNQLEEADRQISELRNFKATNTSASGGINMNHRYSMMPVEEQVKNLEDKKKQLQAQIGAVEDQARKEGVEPGQLR